ncbi:replication-relaxation family protein [Virgisporangium aurantiacum]|uniref:replication-relaxation family protein n=1 Tax=Virgisporangium aurantiacum TaxID=175570 RepID=UPI00194EDAE7|nr:replication-relaxation family protein [Virgisporangium aurantiacum]
MSWRLQPRDYILAALLDEHRTLTTAQISAMLFTSERTCRNRLGALRRLGFVDGFIPIRRGRRLATHWLPGLLSARYVALRDGGRPPSPRVMRERQDRVVATSHLAHVDVTNQFFVDLIAHARRRPRGRLARWWSGTRTAAALGRRVHPDGHGVWRAGGREVAFFLETDLGTENQSVLAAKLGPYHRLQLAGGPGWPVLFWMSTPAREANLLARLGSATRLGVPVATANQLHAREIGPAGRVWTVAGSGPGRVRLVDLASVAGSGTGTVGPLNPGPPTPDEDPLYLLRPADEPAGREPN